MQMMTMQHIVVSVPAGTEICIIFEWSQATDYATGSKTPHVPRVDNTALESSVPSNP
jgi:hypothetical protein